MKVLKCFLFGAAVLGVCVLMHFYGEATAAKEMQEDIAKEVIRLHVVANSDLEMDQKLKLEVKEEIVKMLRKKMKESDSVEAAAHVLQAQIPEIEQCAANYIEKKGYDYPVTATLENCYFPVKQYGDMVFPAGKYEAFRIDIGDSEGKNWWCVLFPPLCFVDSTYAVVPEDTKDEFRNVLSNEAYFAITMSEPDNNYVIRFKYLTFLNKLLD